MKNTILPLLIMAFGFMTMSTQPPVTAGTFFISGLGVVNDYVYVENKFIYTSAETRISFPASFMYLRRGQLLQGGNVTNTGRGFLSVYQEGSVNNFQYNLGAINDFSKAIEISPNDADTYYNRAIANIAIN